MVWTGFILTHSQFLRNLQLQFWPCLDGQSNSPVLIITSTHIFLCVKTPPPSLWLCTWFYMMNTHHYQTNQKAHVTALTLCHHGIVATDFGYLIFWLNCLSSSLLLYSIIVFALFVAAYLFSVYVYVCNENNAVKTIVCHVLSPVSYWWVHFPSSFPYLQLLSCTFWFWPKL